MSKRLLRILNLILVASLLADPVTASAFNRVFPSLGNPIQSPMSVVYDQQALQARLRSALFSPNSLHPAILFSALTILFAAATSVPARDQQLVAGTDEAALTTQFAHRNAWILMPMGVVVSLFSGSWLAGEPASLWILSAWGAALLVVTTHWAYRRVLKHDYEIDLQYQFGKHLVSWWLEAPRIAKLSIIERLPDRFFERIHELEEDWEQAYLSHFLEDTKEFFLINHYDEDEVRREGAFYSGMRGWAERERSLERILRVAPLWMGAGVGLFLISGVAGLPLKFLILALVGPPALFLFIAHEFHNLTSPFGLTTLLPKRLTRRIPKIFASNFGIGRGLLALWQRLLEMFRKPKSRQDILIPRDLSRDSPALVSSEKTQLEAAKLLLNIMNRVEPNGSALIPFEVLLRRAGRKGYIGPSTHVHLSELYSAYTRQIHKEQRAGKLPVGVHLQQVLREKVADRYLRLMGNEPRLPDDLELLIDLDSVEDEGETAKQALAQLMSEWIEMTPPAVINGFDKALNNPVMTREAVAALLYVWKDFSPELRAAFPLQDLIIDRPELQPGLQKILLQQQALRHGRLRHLIDSKLGSGRLAKGPIHMVRPITNATVYNWALSDNRFKRWMAGGYRSLTPIVIEEFGLKTRDRDYWQSFLSGRLPAVVTAFLLLAGWFTLKADSFTPLIWVFAATVLWSLTHVSQQRRYVLDHNNEVDFQFQVRVRNAATVLFNLVVMEATWLPYQVGMPNEFSWPGLAVVVVLGVLLGPAMGLIVHGLWNFFAPENYEMTLDLPSRSKRIPKKGASLNQPPANPWMFATYVWDQKRGVGKIDLDSLDSFNDKMKVEFPGTGVDIVSKKLMKPLLPLEHLPGALRYEVSYQSLDNATLGGWLTPDVPSVENVHPELFFWDNVMGIRRRFVLPYDRKDVLDVQQFAKAMDRTPVRIYDMLRAGHLKPSLEVWQDDTGPAPYFLRSDLAGYFNSFAPDKVPHAYQTSALAKRLGVQERWLIFAIAEKIITPERIGVEGNLYYVVSPAEMETIKRLLRPAQQRPDYSPLRHPLHQVLDTDQLARALGKTPRAVHRLVTDGDLRPVQSVWRNPVHVIRYVLRSTLPLYKEIFAPKLVQHAYPFAELARELDIGEMNLREALEDGLISPAKLIGTSILQFYVVPPKDMQRFKRLLHATPDRIALDAVAKKYRRDRLEVESTARAARIPIQVERHGSRLHKFIERVHEKPLQQRLPLRPPPGTLSATAIAKNLRVSLSRLKGLPSVFEMPYRGQTARYFPDPGKPKSADRWLKRLAQKISLVGKKASGTRLHTPEWVTAAAVALGALQHLFVQEWIPSLFALGMMGTVVLLLRGSDLIPTRRSVSLLRRAA